MDLTAKALPPSIQKISNHEFLNKFDGIDEIHRLLQSRQYELAIPKIEQLCKTTENIDFPLNKGGYTRNILSKKNGYWLSFIHWDKDVITYPHGHPEQAFIYAVKGNIDVSNFEIKPDLPLEPVGSESYSQGDYFFSHGKKDCFDNAIHQIKTNKESLTLHFYSDDPTKGTSYSNEQKYD